VSTKGGDFALWSRDGKELFYQAPNGSLMVVTVRVASNVLAFGEPKPLFLLPGTAGAYDVTPDGQRVLGLRPTGSQASASMTLVINGRPC
jgi:hypothetical protein